MKSKTCESCSACLKQKKSLLKAINECVLVIEMFEPLLEAAKCVSLEHRLQYPPENIKVAMENLNDAIVAYNYALERWRKSHESLPPVSEVLKKCTEEEEVPEM